jgi:mRNA interferase MazF
MPFEFGDVVLVPFPSTSQTASKQRPAVIASSKNYNVTRPDTVVMAITSQFRPLPQTGEVWISQWQAAGLLTPSAVKPVFATLEPALIIRRLGVLGSGDRAEVRRAISQVLA